MSRMLAWLHLTCEGARLGAETGRDEMKYMIMMYGTQQDYDAMAGKAADKPAWSAEEFAAMGAFMESFNKDLEESGELVETPVRVQQVGHAQLGGAGKVDAFRHLRTHRVVLVSRDGDRHQDAEDRDHDHQFDQGKALLHLLHVHVFVPLEV